MMRGISLFLMLAGLALGVGLGGQTTDHTWGPALVALGLAWLAAAKKAEGGEWVSTRGAKWALGLMGVAAGWAVLVMVESPVREYARSDGMLLLALAGGVWWARRVVPEGRLAGWWVAGLTAILTWQAIFCAIQLKDPSFAGWFHSRPAAFPSGSFGHYNHLADFCVVSAGFLLPWVGWGRGWMRWAALAGVVLAVGNVVASGSRGGLLSMGVVMGVGVVLVWLRAWVAGSRHRYWLGAVVWVLPVTVLVMLPGVLKSVQERRGGREDLDDRTRMVQVADNRSRLVHLSVAVDAIFQHPLTGGGSRSYGWQKYAVWDPSAHGKRPSNDDFVHHEWVQAAVDYGLPGALGLGLVVVVTGGMGVMRGVRKSGEDEAWVRVGWGGLMAMAGTLVHSNFSFVTHTLPGALYLGLAMGWALPMRRADPREVRGWWSRWVPAGLAGGAALWLGSLATAAYRELWPAFYGRGGVTRAGVEEMWDRIEKVERRWPSGDWWGVAGMLARRGGEMAGTDEPELRREWYGRSVRAYEEAERMQPFDPQWPINRANVLVASGRDDEATEAYERAVLLQGKTEGSFRARYQYAEHLYRLWYQRWRNERRAAEALHEFLRARELLRGAEEQTYEYLFVRAGGKELKEGLEETIRFLEGAQVRPVAPEKR